MLTDGISWVRLPGISEEGSKLQLKADISPSKEFWCVPHFPHHVWQESTMSGLGLLTAARQESQGSAGTEGLFQTFLNSEHPQNEKPGYQF